MDQADISAITLVYCDQPSPLSPPPSPPFPPHDFHSYEHIAMPAFPLEEVVEEGILNKYTGEMEVNKEHLPIFNEALVGSQELEDLIPDDDVNGKHAGK
jgi:hypothetical protein